jgi:Aerotolerance regulator N-terminal
MSFLNPIWLWGLSGLAIPLAIHLLSRKEGKVIRIGSLRYLSESTTQQFKSLKLNEVLLLAVRLLLITLIVMLMSGLQLQTDSKEKWLLIEPLLQDNESIARVRDSLTEDGFDTRHFVEGFPRVDQDLDKVEAVNNWSLVKQLEDKPVEEAVIISSSRMADFNGEPITLPEFVKWIAVDPGKKEFILTARRLTKDSAELRRGITDATRTEFVSTSFFVPNGQKILPSDNSISISSPDTLRINLVTDTGFELDKKIILAALQTIRQKAKVIVELREDSNEAKTDEWLFWFSEKQHPKFWAKVVSFKESNSAELITQVGLTEWTLSAHLHKDIALNKKLLFELTQVLLPQRNRTKADREDMRVMPEAMLWSSANTTSKISKVETAIDGWLILALCMTLIIERFLSHRKNL